MQTIEEASEIPQDSHLHSVDEVQPEQATNLETPVDLMHKPQTTDPGKHP